MARRIIVLSRSQSSKVGKNAKNKLLHEQLLRQQQADAAKRLERKSMLQAVLHGNGTLPSQKKSDKKKNKRNIILNGNPKKKLKVIKISNKKSLKVVKKSDKGKIGEIPNPTPVQVLTLKLARISKKQPGETESRKNKRLKEMGETLEKLNAAKEREKKVRIQKQLKLQEKHKRLKQLQKNSTTKQKVKKMVITLRG